MEAVVHLASPSGIKHTPTIHLLQCRCVICVLLFMDVEGPGLVAFDSPRSSLIVWVTCVSSSSKGHVADNICVICNLYFHDEYS